jgi:hypothetical protein
LRARKEKKRSQKEKIQIEFWVGDKLIGKTKTTFLGPAKHH